MRKKHNSSLTNLSQTLRKNMTPEEKRLWYDCLSKLPVTVRRQKIIGHYIVVFYISNPQIVIELDGSQHGEGFQRLKDIKRDFELRELGCQILRYPNNLVRQHFDDVCRDIESHIFATETSSN